MEQYVGILDLMMIRLPCQQKKTASLVSQRVLLIGIPSIGACLKEYPKLKTNKMEWEQNDGMRSELFSQLSKIQVVSYH